MKLLLDTHTLLWWWQGDNRLSRKAISYLKNEETELYVSAASAFEIATKFRIGKLTEAFAFLGDFEAGLSMQGIRHLPLTVAHARRAGLLEGAHRDPFDRMLAAQSLIEDLPIVSRDPALAAFGAQTLW